MCEETKPHPHKDVIIAYANGATIEWRDPVDRHHPQWVEISNPGFHSIYEYRVKPKPKVKKWRWVYENADNQLVISNYHYASEKELNEVRFGCAALQKIDSTMIEVEE